MVKQLLAAFVLMNSFISPANAQPNQQWIDTVNGANENDLPGEVAVDALGNVYVAGSLFVQIEPGLFGPHLILVKYAPGGQKLWTRTYSRDGSASGMRLALDPVDGSPVVAGLSGIVGFNESWTFVKYDTMGNLQWERHHTRQDSGIVGPADLFIDSQQNVWATGGDVVNGNSVAVILKYAANGTPQLTMNYSGSFGSYEGAAILSDPTSDSFYVAGSSGIFGSGDGVKMALMKFNAAGAIQWTSLFGIPGSFVSNVAGDLEMDAEGNLVVGGTWGINSADSNLGIVKVRPGGSTVWEASVDGGSLSTDGFRALGVAPDGSVYAVGSHQTPPGPNSSSDAIVARIDPLGSLAWVRTAGVPTWTEWFSDVVADTAGNAYVVGTLARTTGATDATMKKYAPNGDLQWTDTPDAAPVGSGRWSKVVVSEAIGQPTAVIALGDIFTSATRQDIMTVKLTEPTVVPPCPGDANGDAAVNAADLSVLLAGFGTSVPPGTGADLNADGNIDAADLSILLSTFGNIC